MTPKTLRRRLHLLEGYVAVTALKLPNKSEQTVAFQSLASKGMLGHQRVFVGKSADRSAAANLFDAEGKPRLRLRVDASGTATIEFLDENGNVLQRLPQAK
jgi:hypothetical protein